MGVMPFILRGVKLLGIDSVQAPMDVRREVWEELGRIGLPKAILETVVSTYTLEDVAGNLGPMTMTGKIQGRALIDMAKQPADTPYDSPKGGLELQGVPVS